MAELNISFVELVTAKLTTDEEDTNEHLKEAFRTRFQSNLNNFFLRHASIPMNYEFTLGSQMLNALELASHRCGPGSVLSSDHMWVKFVVGSFSAPRGFPPGTPVFPSPQKPALRNSSSTRNVGHKFISSKL